MQTLFGMKIITNPHIPATIPKRKLSVTVLVSDEFRVEFDAWLEEFFGKDLHFLILEGHTIVTVPENLVALRIAVDRITQTK